jgi:hypothetical protein
VVICAGLRTILDRALAECRLMQGYPWRRGGG